jgi:hypothetical protein
MAAKKQFDVPRMRRQFLSTSITLRELAKQHKCSYRYVSGLSSQERWYPQRRELKAQQESAMSEALVERVAERSAELAQLKVATTEQHIQRSLQTGEHLNALLQQGLAALQSQDSRALKATIESWVTLDNQMRKIHKVDTTHEKPLINISVLSALPRTRTTVA